MEAEKVQAQEVSVLWRAGLNWTPRRVQKGDQRGSRGGRKRVFISLAGRFPSKLKGAFLDNRKNTYYFVGFMCKSEICHFRNIFEIIGPEFSARRASKGHLWIPIVHDFWS